jgi:CubicO group peptidase (beta-lactamase class C family)
MAVARVWMPGMRLRLVSCESHLPCPRLVKEADVRTFLAVLVFVLLYTGIGPECARAVPPGMPAQKVANEQFNEAKDIINEAIRERRIASAVVGVSQNGKIAWLEAFGWANGPQRIQATAHTAYPIASITKPLTATVIMMLAEQGRIDIDRPAEEYIKPLKFKSYQGKSKDVTVRHLLNHTSGLPMHFDYFYGDEPYSPPPFEETLERYGILVHRPGEVFQYANLGYGVLGHIISQVTGMSYEDFMRTELFEPMGMMTTYIGPDKEWTSVTAQKYSPTLKPVPQIEMDSPAAGETFSCAYDLVRFGMFSLKNNMPGSPQLVSRETIDIMQSGKSATAAYTSADYYGLGWYFNENEHGYRVVWHGGGIEGASSMLKLVPSENISVVVLINTWSPDLTARITESILGVLLPGYKESNERGSGRAASGFVPYEPSQEFTGRWEGQIKTYAGDIPIYMVFQEDGDIHLLKELEIDHTWVLQNQGYFDKVLNNVGMSGDRIYGWVDARIPTGDALREPHVIVIDIVRDGDELNGSVSAVSAAERMYYALSYYITLKKQ